MIKVNKMPEEKEKRMTVHFQMDSERAVRDAFARYHVELGYPKILVSQEAFPDYILEDASGNRIRAEAEFRSSGYNHPLDGCDLVVCWEINKKLPIHTLELCRHIEVPHIFEDFMEEELDSISESVKRYAVVANKSKNLLRELALFVKRRDLNSVCSKVVASGESYDEPIVAETYSLNHGREGWEVHPVLVSINLLKEKVLIEGKLHIYLPQFKTISLERWKELIQGARNKGFTSTLIPYGPGAPQEISFDTLVRSLPDTDKIWSVAFTQKHDLTFLCQKRDSILDSLSATIVLLLDFLEHSGFYGQQGM